LQTNNKPLSETTNEKTKNELNQEVESIIPSLQENAENSEKSKIIQELISAANIIAPTKVSKHTETTTA
jgi:hypothetical protein